MSHAGVITPTTRSDAALPHAYDLVCAQVRRNGGAPALLAADGSGGVTYAELLDRVDALAGQLVASGVGPDVPVAVLLDHPADTVVAMLATAAAGGVYCPLDATAPDVRLAAAVHALGASVAVAGETAAHRLPAGTVVVPPSATGPASPPPRPRPDSLAYVLHTSGSTGAPKGVAMTHAGLARLLRWQIDDGEPGLRTLQFTATSFDVTFQEVLSTLATGGCLVVVPAATRRDPDALLDVIIEHRVQRLFLPYVALQLLAVSAQRRGRVPETLRHVVTAGERLMVTTAVRALFAALPHCRLDNHYGPTEAHLVTSHTLRGDASGWPLLPPIGTAVDGVTCRVLDDELRAVQPGEVGELYVGGTGVARGYLNAPGLTAERFVADPAGTGGRLYRTGDLVRPSTDGGHDFVGRTDEQLKVRGFRVEPGEVEIALSSHPRVVAAAVGLREVAQGVSVLVGYLQTDGAVSHRDITGHVRGLLPSSMIPSRFVAVAALPRTGTGKIDGRALAELELPGSPEPDGGPPAASTADPVALLTAIWTRVLGHDEFEPDDDFFDVGGDSLLATWVVAELGQALGRPVELSVFLDHSTVEELAQTLGSGAAVAAHRRPSQIVTLRPGPSGRSLYLLHPLGGELLGYRELARASRAPMRLLGVGWSGEPPLFGATLEEIAAVHVEQLRVVEPDGPYRLAGWSFGGVLAFEVAQQLTRAGAEVVFLGLLDANPLIDPITGLPMDRTPFLDVLTEVVDRLDDPAADLSELTRGTTWTQLMGAPIAAGSSAAHLRTALETARACMSAAMRYRPVPHPGPVHLFPAEGPGAERRERLVAALHGLCPGGLTVVPVPGDHWTFLRGEHVAGVAGELDAALERAGRRSTTDGS